MMGYDHETRRQLSIHPGHPPDVVRYLGGRRRPGDELEEEAPMKVRNIGRFRRGGKESGSMRRTCGTQVRGTRRRRGASATELAVILPLFITIVLGCVDFGRFAYTYIAVSNAARAAAAWEMMNPPGSMTSPSTGWQNQVKQ